jgi:hypothetical protein
MNDGRQVFEMGKGFGDEMWWGSLGTGHRGRLCLEKSYT